jgi:hypothetical protein
MMVRQKRALAFESEGRNGPEDLDATLKVLDDEDEDDGAQTLNLHHANRHVFIEWNELLLKKKEGWERLKRMGLWPSEQGNNSNKKT